MIIAGLLLVFASILASMWRLRRATTRADRVIALDVISFQAIGALVGFSLLDGSPLALESALIISLIGFLTTLALTHLLVPRPPSSNS
jgi:multisubunit Na+/H+ antiporter MnhF subunit